jgi:HlyD family secretion protein
VSRAPASAASGGALLLALALAGCGGDGDRLQLVGSVERTLVEVSAAVSEVIVALPVERGRHVAAGAVVVRLDSVYAEAEAAQAEAAVAGARTRQTVSDKDLVRATDLMRRKVVAEDELEHAQLAAEEAAAALREAEARLRAARKRVADCTLLSPVAGVVDQLPYEVGERVPAGAVVAVILQDDAPWVRVWIPEPALARLATGAPAEVRIDGFAPAFAGRVEDIAREPEFTPHYALTERDRVHLVYEARVRLADAPAALRPGAPATVIIPLGAAPAVAGAPP